MTHPAIPRTAVKSSNVHSIGYDATTRTLHVEYLNGSIYAYHDLEPEQHAALMKATSIGSHLHAHIKGRYRVEKVSS